MEVVGTQAWDLAVNSGIWGGATRGRGPRGLVGGGGNGVDGGPFIAGGTTNAGGTPN